MPKSNRASPTRIVALATLVVGAMLGVSCARPTSRSASPRPSEKMDSAMLAQCYTPPETTATGQVGCVLRDQGIKIPERKP